MSKNDVEDQKQSHLQTNDEINCKIQNEVLKRRSLLINVMKPSLSLTSLPPQSPKEKNTESSSNTERPYNSLKKKRDIEQKELWRRSWESQNSVSTTTTSTGRNDFWAAYNYIMDNSIIDSCKEANGEAKSSNIDEDTKIFSKSNFKDSASVFNLTKGSQGSKALDSKRLRRWIREMECRISKLPSLKEAMILNLDDLRKFSIESADLYREINSNGRFVGACIRSFEKENCTKIEEPPTKILDYTEHDSLDTITTSTTTTSNDSKRSVNVLKALERRYHLLYLNAIEIQCMYEGLLEKRNSFNSKNNEQEFETSDEEPVAKIPKIDSNSKFTSTKCSNELNANGIDADSEDSCDEMECRALNGSDCIDNKIVPINSSKEEEEVQPFLITPTAVKKRSKDFSKFNRSNRKSKNCAIFYYKHIDSDNDPSVNIDNSNKASETSEEEIWEYANAGQQLDFNECKEMTSSNEDMKVAPSDNLESKTTSIQKQNSTSKSSQLITKEALRELVLEAESLVLQKIQKKSITKQHFSNAVPSSSNPQKSVTKKMMDRIQKESSKIDRVEEWLKMNQDPALIKIPNNQPVTVQSTDCEASGETSSCSVHSDSSEEITDSVATCLQGIENLQTSTECLEHISPVHKVNMRVKPLSNRRHSERPWSVSCLSQLTRNSQQSFSDIKVEETTNCLASFSISESALNKIQKYRTTSESDSKNNKTTVDSIGSKSSLKKRKIKLRKKSLSSNRRSDSSSSDANILRSMSKSDSFNITLMEDLSTAISMMSFMKDNNDKEKTENMKTTVSDDEQVIKTPDFKIGSLTNVYGNRCSLNLGSLATLANYNNEPCENSEIPTENLSSISEHNMWDNYMEKYNSEAYSEDRDIDGARKLLDFGDDYRNFIDSQSDCCSSLSCANQIDSLSPPRDRKNLSAKNTSLTSSNDNSILRQKRKQEIPEGERKMDWDVTAFIEVNRHDELLTTLKSKSVQPVESSSDDELGLDAKKILDSEKALEQTKPLQMANSHFLRPEDYVRLRLNSFLDNNEAMVKNARCSDMCLINCKDNKLLSAGRRNDKDELIGSKGFCSYVSFVTSYVIFLVIVTYLLNQIGKI